jgi:hypothetical protein
MALLAAGSALVAGGHFSEGSEMQTQKVRVVRAFYFNREALAVNSEHELPALFAREVIAANKAVAVSGEARTAPAPKPDARSKSLV